MASYLTAVAIVVAIPVVALLGVTLFGAVLDLVDWLIDQRTRW